MIASFIERARRRFLWNEVLAQFALAAAIFMGGAVILLLLGTQILDWRVIVALAAAGLGFGLWRTLRRMPSAYQIAVLVDQRAGLFDAISTAFHFRDDADEDSVRKVQRQHAERLLAGVNVDHAIPLTLPRAIYAMALLGVAASALFALRYGIHRQLDLHAPLSQVVMEGLGLHPAEDKVASLRKKAAQKNGAREEFDDTGAPLPRSAEKRKGELDSAPGSALETVGDPEMGNENAKSSSAKSGDGKGEGAENQDGKDGAESSEAGTPSSGKNASDNPAGSKDGPQQGERGASQQQSGGNNSSLLSKMKDAVSNLLSKAKPQQNSPAGQKPSAGQQGGQKTQAQQKSGEKGAAGKSQDGGQQESADSQQGDQQSDADSSENSQGKGGGKSSDQQAAAQPGSGVGKQDGSKDLKAAEQMAAMGKLSEVMGKRAQNVSGEMMLDTQSGPQTLKTQYSLKSATHNESTGEVSRDEVPVAVQSYVQQYFEEVRKTSKSKVVAKP